MTIFIQSHMSRVMRKPDVCLCENKGADQLCCNSTADQRLCFRYRIVQYTQIQDSSCHLLLCRQVCVRPGRKPRRLVFSRRGSYVTDVLSELSIKIMFVCLFDC